MARWLSGSQAIACWGLTGLAVFCVAGPLKADAKRLGREADHRPAVREQTPAGAGAFTAAREDMDGEIPGAQDQIPADAGAPREADPPAGEKHANSSVRSALESSAALLDAGRPREALDALALVERIEPDNPWLWFYRGMAHRQIGGPYRAMECFDRALDLLAAMGQPDPELRDAIRVHRTAARRQTFSISLQTGLAYDTNVSFLGAGSTTLGLISGRPDGKFASRFQLDYAPIASPQETVAFGARLGHAWHFSIKEYDYQDYGGYVRYARRLDDRWEPAIQYDYDVMYLGREPFLSAHAVSPSLTYHWPRTSAPVWLDRTEVAYRWEARDFLFDTTPEFDRDGPIHSVGIEQRLKCRPAPASAWTWDVGAGYRFDSIPTEGTEFDQRVHNFHVDLEVPLVNPWALDQFLILPDRELLFGFRADWELGDYRGASLIDEYGRGRSDRIMTYSFWLSQTLLDDSDAGRLVLNGLIQWMDAHSNVVSSELVSPFTYDKAVYGVQLEWSW